MKIALFSVSSLCFLYCSAQGSFSNYLETVEPKSLSELASEIMKPQYSLEFKSSLSMVEDYVNKAMEVPDNYTETDLDNWKSSITYLVGLGYPLNESKNGLNQPIFYLTSHFYSAISDSVGSNRYKLHTALIERGGKTDTRIDGVSYLSYVLGTERDESRILKEYLIDFSSWTIERKRTWLFTLMTEEDGNEMNVMAMQRLIDLKLIDVNLRTKNEKESLFDVAIRSGNFEVADILLEAGYKVNQRCFACIGETALHIAVANEKYPDDIYDLLLKILAKGGDPDLRDIKGFTPLHWAIQQKNIPAFEALMSQEVTFSYNLLTIKELNYLAYFNKEWNDDDFRVILMEKTGLKPPPTKKERKALKKLEKEKLKKSKKAKKSSSKKK